MKAYTLRLDDHLLMSIKEIGLKENKSLKQFIIEAIEEKLSKNASKSSKSEDLKRRKMYERAARLASRLTDDQVVASIREDRDR